ncbi:hypothetical protein EHO60_00345 [Leptospira fletcheri]|uniref:Uncharacterized protein n=1 Tax=Leptospira fletcheri TaxID=2484981 RepID=A0A4R9GJE8_9LEPT|nr:hypothetical protein [Leptospira fletcheri]TGK13844.1 hypothetical protein EHO60_00345 [Leptospira fletcheri]
MNVNGMQNGGKYFPQWSPPPKETDRTEIRSLDPVELRNSKIESGKKKLPEPEELVMKPSPVSTEERMSQVISPEQMKDLLSMIVSSRFSRESNESMPVRKIDQKG